jgi:hypothetical protein
MRAMIVASMAAVLVTAMGVAGLKAAGLQPNTHAAIAALGAAIAASVLAGVPMLVVRGRSQLAVAQAGLAATTIHLLVLAGAAFVMILGRSPLGNQIVPWLGAMYATTLIALIVAILRAIRLAPPPGKIL